MEQVHKVFDNEDLRKIIVTYIVHEKYKKEVKNGITQLFTESLVKKWYKYCSCELCKSNREYNIANYGELL